MNNSPPSNHSAPKAPARIGHYELRDCVGRGGMGLVYRALDTRLDRQVAIKCLRTELFEHHYIERFKREALLLAKLNHPNIVQIYDFIEAPDQIALVMELVEGQNLQLHLREHIVPFALRMRWLTEIAQGLAVAHDAGIIHRDLKAENILINQRKVAKITDLGIAKSQDFNGTLTDHVAGSYCSMSPEQAMGEPLDFKSDLFSLGILAYQLLCGAHPFGDTNNKLQLMQRIISHPPIAPGKHNPNLPPEINELLGQLLSKDPAKRPDNTHWVAAQLEKLSHLQLANDFVSDDTQTLIANVSAANQSNVKNTGIKNSVSTQDHPTFETRFVAVSTAPKKSRWLPIKNYLLENKISVSFGLFSLLLLAAVAVWQLQPKPPKYVAVIPPKLTAEGMQESQQELVKGAVYDAIQQSVIQLDGYYLIPREEIADVNGDNETVRRATAADEILTADMRCKVETCTITLTRLTPDKNEKIERLKVENTKTINALTESYASLADITQKITYAIYSNAQIKTVIYDENSYSLYLAAHEDFLKKGSSKELIANLDMNKDSLKKIAQFEDLYVQTALDLFYETEEDSYLKKVETLIDNNQRKGQSIEQLTNLYYLYLAKNDFQKAEEIIKKIQNTHPNPAMEYSLIGYMALTKNDLNTAERIYKQAISLKNTSSNHYNLALTYWKLGKIPEAQKELSIATTLAPKDFKSHRLLGAIAMVSGNIDQAINSFEFIIKVQKNDLSSINNLGLAYMLNKNFTKAMELFDTALEIAPQNSIALLNLADAKNLNNERTNAADTYQKVISISKTDTSRDATRNLAQSYAHLGDFSKALTYLQALQRSDPDNVDTLYSAALIYTLADDNTSAVIYIQKALANGLSPIWFKSTWFDRVCRIDTSAKTDLDYSSKQIPCSLP